MAEHVYNNFFTPEKWEEVNIVNKAIMDDYLQECQQRQMKDSTIKQYKNDWRIVMIKIMEMFGNKSILELNKKDWRKLSLYFKNSCEHSNARVNRLMSASRSMLAYCEDDDEDYEDYNTNTAGKVKGLGKEKVRDIIFYTDEDICKLYDSLMEKEEYQKACLLMLAYDSAGRKNELLQVKKFGFYNKNVNASSSVIGKRGKEFQLVYFSKTKEAAELYLKERGEDDLDFMFTIGNGDALRPITGEAIYGWFKNFAKEMGQPEGNVHSMRHSCLENLSQAVHTHYALKEVGRPEGLSLEELQLHANHGDSSTTASYLKDKSGEQKLSMFGFGIELEEDTE
jgi:integrase